MNISGSGHISAGEYNEKIAVSGSAKIDGNVRCLELACSGAVSAAGDLHCAQDARVSGSMRIDQHLTAQNLKVSGSVKVGGDCTAENEIKVSGAMNCRGNLKCALLKSAGKITVGGGIEAEEVKTAGVANCDGLLNAEKVEIKLDGASSYVGSIGGSDIRIWSERKKQMVTRLPLFSKLIGGSGGLQVREEIEGDVIAIENVCTPLVVGRIVAIGEGCQIDLVRYSETIEIHPDAKVERYEKV